MIRRFMTTIAFSSLLAGGLAVSYSALAQEGQETHGSRHGRGGLMMMADADKDGVLTREELTAALDARFARLDVNKDGKIDQQDRDLMRQQRLDARFAAMDTDKNGQISKAEYIAAQQARRDKWDQAGRDRPGGASRRRWDRHGSGVGFGMMRHTGANGPVTREQFLAGPLAMFDKADVNKDGKVTADEMKAARQAMRSEWKDRKGPPPPPPAD